MSQKDNSGGSGGRPRAFLSKRELAAHLGLSVYTIDSWVSERREIPHVKMGRRVMFDTRDVDNWVERNKVLPEEL